MDPLAAYLPALTGGALFSLAAALAVMTACAAIGSLVGRDARDGGDLIVGVGLSGGALSIWGTSGLPLVWGAVVLGVVGAGAIIVRARQGTLPGGAMWRTLVIMTPLLLVAACSVATMWDDFFHWLPNAAYVFRTGYLPGGDQPVSLSKWPGYPHTMPFIVAAASWLTGQFQENAGPVANVVFLSSFAALLAEPLTKGQRSTIGLRWGAAGAGAALAVLLNPAFDHNVLFASYADVATAVAVAVCGAFGVGVVGAMVRGRLSDAGRLSWRFAFAATALINLKQANVVLLVLVLLALALMVVIAGRPAMRSAVRRLPVLLVAPVIVFVVWRLHVLALGTGGEMSFRVPAAWNYAVFDQTLSQVGHVMTEAPAFFVLVYAVTLLGLWAWWRPDTPGRRLLALTAVVWIGYNVFLAVVYLGAMTAEEAANAADYWRYTPHVGYLALLALVTWIAELVGRHRSVVRRLPKAWPLAPAMVFVLIGLGVWFAPSAKAWPMHFRAVGREAEALLPDGARVVILGTYHLDPVGTAWIYDVSGQERPQDRNVRALLHPGTLSDVAADVKAGTVGYALATDWFWPLEKEEAALGLPHLTDRTALFKWNGVQWDLVASWPLPARR